MEGTGTLIQKQIITLNYLYHLQMFGEEFCDEIPLSQTLNNSPLQNSQVLGWDPKGAKVGFITLAPLLDSNNTFLMQKSSQMLQDIISKVFFLTQEQCGIFSLFKTQDPSYDPQNNFKYREVLLAQIAQSQAKVFVVFGLEEMGQILFPNQNIQLGRAVKLKEKILVFTHSIKALLKLEGLKKQTMQHLKYTKALM